MAETGNCEWNERTQKAQSRLKQLIDVLSDMEHITNGFDEGRNLVEDTPAADMVNMVRCEHCKHSWFNGVDLWLCHREAKSYCPTVKADAFCSYGERKEETP